LQDAGGEIGDNYTKLKGYANSYGVRLTDEQLKNKGSRSITSWWVNRRTAKRLFSWHQGRYINP
jgi:hypothetical protein